MNAILKKMIEALTEDDVKTLWEELDTDPESFDEQLQEALEERFPEIVYGRSR